MSEGNVEIVMESLRRFEAGEPLDDMLDEDAFMTAMEGWPEQGPFKGREALMEQFHRVMAAWTNRRVTDLEVIGQDEDWVVVQYRWHLRGSTSGIDTSFDMAAAYKLKDGLFAQVHYRLKRDDALEAAGLSE